MAPFAAGNILVLNWRGDGFPKEANRIRPCVVVEDAELFSEEHANVIVVPLTTSSLTVISQLTCQIPPTSENGLERMSFAPAYMVTSASKDRIDGPPIGQITPAQLQSIRTYIAESLGIS